MAEAALSQLAVYTARPTVRIDGEDHPKVQDLLIGLEMRESEGGMSALEMRLSNVASDTSGGADLAFEDETLVRLGAGITVYGGDESAPQEIFRGTITGLDAEFPATDPPELIVLAEDVLQRARMTRRTAVHEVVSIADLATTLANSLSLTPVVTGFTEPIGTRVQLNESDLAFLRRLLCRYDGDLQIVGNELHVSPRAEAQRGILELELHSQLRRVRLMADLADQVTEVTASGWDPINGERVRAVSNGVNSGPGQGRPGAGILVDAVGERSEHIRNIAVTTRDEAQALADAAFDRRARRLVCIEATAEGNPALRVGTHVTITGVSPRFDNTYYVVCACHRYDIKKGYETNFRAESAFLGEP